MPELKIWNEDGKAVHSHPYQDLDIVYTWATECGEEWAGKGGKVERDASGKCSDRFDFMEKWKW